MNALQHWRLNPNRFVWHLDQASTTSWAMWLVPLLFGLLSLKFGQDNNWDLRNYHFYNAYAFLNGKVGLDLAPAQMQTYFNPTIDLPYYGLIKVLPGPVVGFIMGVIQGLNFILVVLIARALFPTAPNRLPLLLALAGICGNGFLSGLGNTMGDNLMALPVLGSLVLVIHTWPRLRMESGNARVLVAGGVMGLAVGLKLTVAVFALALCLSLLALPLPVVARGRLAFLFGVGVVLGIAVAGGHWFWKMWSLYGNPLFPQFNNIFHASLANPISIVDTRFLPNGWFEHLVWPMVFVFDWKRVTETNIVDPIWAVLYVGSTLLLLKMLKSRQDPMPLRNRPEMPNGLRPMMVMFVVTSFLVWMMLFSIYRYLVPIELLAPLMLWLLAQKLLPRASAGPVATVALLAIIASNFPHEHWGYVHWARTTISGDVRAFKDPGQSIVFTAQYDKPLAWVIPLFPKHLAFVGLASNFPESGAYRQRIAAMLAARKGPFYVIFHNSGAEVDASLSPTLRARGLKKDPEIEAGVRDTIAGYGLQLDPASCTIHPAYLGAFRYNYKLCQVRLVPVAS
jgi:hypothetical protein